MLQQFTDRTHAGRELAARLMHLRDRNVIVLGLPRGGVPIAAEVAAALAAPLEVLNVRKIGVPWHEEVAMGAIASGGIRVLNPSIIMGMGVTSEALAEATQLQQVELDRRERAYRGGRPAPALRGRTVVIIDDGIATGATARAAIDVVRIQEPERIILAVPVIQASVAEEFRTLVDELVAIAIPGDLMAVGAWYDHFPQLTDDEVRSILARHALRFPGESAASTERAGRPVS